MARELVPVDEAFMRKGEDDDEESSTTLGLEQKGLKEVLHLSLEFVVMECCFSMLSILNSILFFPYPAKKHVLPLYDHLFAFVAAQTHP